MLLMCAYLNVVNMHTAAGVGFEVMVPNRRFTTDYNLGDLRIVFSLFRYSITQGRKENTRKNGLYSGSTYRTKKNLPNS